MANTNTKIFNPCLKFRSMQKACHLYFPWTLSILDSIVCLDFSPKDYRKGIVFIFLAKIFASRNTTNPKFLALLEKVTKIFALNSFCTHGSTAASM